MLLTSIVWELPVHHRLYHPRNLVYHLNVNKGLSKHSIRAYKVDSQGYIDTSTKTGRVFDQPKERRQRLVSLVTSPPRNKPVSASTLNRKRSTIRNLPVDDLHGVTTITSNVSIPKIPKRNPKFMTIPEVAKVVENPAQDGHFRQRNQAILEMIYGAGLRVSGAAKLDVEHLDFSGVWSHD